MSSVLKHAFSYLVRWWFIMLDIVLLEHLSQLVLFFGILIVAYKSELVNYIERISGVHWRNRPAETCRIRINVIVILFGAL